MSKKIDDLLDTTIDPGEDQPIDPGAELAAVLEDLEALLKNGDVVSVLTTRGVNASIALLAVSGVAAYLRGDKAGAAEDLGAAAEEIKGRAAAGKIA
jgi:hypothetical protein